MIATSCRTGYRQPNTDLYGASHRYGVEPSSPRRYHERTNGDRGGASSQVEPHEGKTPDEDHAHADGAVVRTQTETDGADDGTGDVEGVDHRGAPGYPGSPSTRTIRPASAGGAAGMLSRSGASGSALHPPNRSGAHCNPTYSGQGVASRGWRRPPSRRRTSEGRSRRSERHSVPDGPLVVAGMSNKRLRIQDRD